MRHYGYRCILDAQYKDEKVKIDYEPDGPLHFTLKGMEYDCKREAYINSQGYRVLRVPYFLMYEPE
jgi:very-short-patch-repair endonuclease